jgi:protein-tyrosine phosphatase
MTSAEAAADRFAVLHVCTGNICRSPMAERLMRAGLVRRLGPAVLERIAVESAGTWGHTGAPMERFAVATLAELGVTGDDFTARELTAPMVAAAGLVLAATREHRAAVVTLHPEAITRTFTLREFGRLAAVVDPATLPRGDVVARARGLIAAAAAARGSTPPVLPVQDDVGDPYGAPLALFRDAAALIADALARPLELLGADGEPGKRAGRATLGKGGQ